MLYRRIKISHSLRFNTLGRINDQKHPFTGCQGAGYFIGKIHMSGSIDEIEFIFFTLAICIWQSHGLAFYGDSPLPFDIHIVKNLIPKMTIIHQPGYLNQTVSQCGFSMVNMGNNAKVSYIFHVLFHLPIYYFYSSKLVISFVPYSCSI